jgi:chemotaxis protein MotB
MARKRRGGEEEHENLERWLVTFADLMVLLFALFMILWSISSVNKSKYESLQRSLAEAFSGKVVPSGQSIMEKGGSNNVTTPAVNEPFNSVQPHTGGRPEEELRRGSVDEETRRLQELQRRIEAIARQYGVSGKIQTRVDRDGLYIRLLTDHLLFDSGSATVRRESTPMLRAIGRVLAREGRHPVRVEGHTDTVPISGTFPSNWELSGARAAGIARAFISAGVKPERLTAVGRAYLDPVASNSTATGRSLNRRVEILLPRMAELPKTGTKTASKTNVFKP